MRARRITIVAVLATAGLLAAACGGSSSSSTSTSSGPSGVLTIDNESGGTLNCDFNPFNLSYIGYQVAIVDQKVWSKIANPVTYPDKNPVGTGAFEVSSKTCTPQNIKYTANPHYWQKGLPKVATVNYPSFLTNDTANTFLANGQAQWGGQFIPNIQSFYTSKSPNYHYWFPPVANVSLFINLTNPILKNVAV